ncbi:MAG: prenyltransferase [Oscillospiraceae bacterium]|nr:prenyltransferase [Oscillospiraceae bacterium]
MVKRWYLYCREMYPLGLSLTAAVLLEGALYFLTVLTCRVPFEPSAQEWVGGLTVFCALLFLRIADDFKDEELDRRLFPSRPYPSGRVTRRDLQILLVLDVLVMTAANLMVVNTASLVWFAALMGYMILMCVWFFQKKRIQQNLLLALVTHNPCMLLMNYYLLSITCRRYGLPLMTLDFFCVNLMLYFPALEYEISRKIKAPSMENEYVTYSKTLGFRPSVLFLLVVSLIELAATEYIAFLYFPRAWCAVFALYYLGYCAFALLYLRRPEDRRLQIGAFARGYIVVMQGTLIVAAALAVARR